MTPLTSVRRWLSGKHGARTGLLLALSVVSCGGATDRDAAESAKPKPTVESLRFSQLAAGRDRYCGLTRDEGRLVCVEDGAVSLERPGPFQELALHEDLETYRELCTLDQEGELSCDYFQEPLPRGPLRSLALGFFNSCALGDGGRPVCWMPDALGGTPDLPIAGALQLSVDMERACVRLDQVGHVQCFGGLDASDEVVSGLHLVSVSAAATAVCGIHLDPSMGDTGVVCVRDGQMVVQLAGAFSSLDTDVNGAGCATDTTGVIRCWGGYEVPSHPEPLYDVTVSTTRVCAMAEDGAAHCFPQPIEP